MASSAHRQTLSGISSQAGLATFQGAKTGPQPLALVELIDAYAASRAYRDECYRDMAAWAFYDAHAAMLTARAAVAEAHGIPASQLAALADPISRAAERGTSADNLPEIGDAL